MSASAAAEASPLPVAPVLTASGAAARYSAARDSAASAPFFARVIASVASLLGAMFCYHVVERPVRQWKPKRTRSIFQACCPAAVLVDAVPTRW